jgi:hypothetical protein
MISANHTDTLPRVLTGLPSGDQRLARARYTTDAKDHHSAPTKEEEKAWRGWTCRRRCRSAGRRRER